MKSVTNYAVRKIGQFIRTDKQGKNAQLTVDLERMVSEGKAELWYGRDKTADGVERHLTIPSIVDCVDSADRLFVHLPYATSEDCMDIEELFQFASASYDNAIEKGWTKEEAISKLETSIRLLDNEVAFDAFKLKLARQASVDVNARLAEFGTAIAWVSKEKPEVFAQFVSDPTNKTIILQAWIDAGSPK